MVGTLAARWRGCTRITALLALITLLGGCVSRPPLPQPFVSSILPTPSPQSTRAAVAGISPLPSPTGQSPFTYNSVSDLLTRRPPPGRTVEVDAYYSRYINRSSAGPSPRPDEVVCERFPAWLADGPAGGCEDLADGRRSCSRPPDAPYVNLLLASSIGPGRLPVPPDLPYHARFVGHLNDPLLAHCPDAGRIFVLERVAVVYEEKSSLPASATATVPSARAVLNLGSYRFGPATVVLTSTSDIEISGWLPDSRRLLIVRRESEHPGDEYVETFDVGTRQLQRYGQRIHGVTPPVWLPAANKVAYTGLTGQRTDLWIAGAGGSGADTPVMQNVWYAIAGLNDSVFALARGEASPVMVNGSGQVTGRVGVDLQAWGFTGQRSGLGMASQPYQRLVAIYDNPNALITIDLNKGVAHRVDLGEEASEFKGYSPSWAVGARWSPDGRYLALGTTTGQPVFRFTALRLLDVPSGIVKPLAVPPRYLIDIAWAPDSKYLAVLAQGLSAEAESWGTLYLVNAVSGDVTPILPGTTFGIGPGFASLAWSPDGRTIAIRCPSRLEGRLCTIAVSR